MTSRSLPPLALGLTLIALISGGCLAEGRGNAKPLPPGSKLWAAATPKGYKTLSGLDSFERDAGKRVSLFMYFESWGQFPDFDAQHAEAVSQRAALPILSWEPWDWSLGREQPRYRLRAIAGGAYDPYLRRWAKEIRNWG